jgi:phosphonate transport system substrate-binding protein
MQPKLAIGIAVPAVIIAAITVSLSSRSNPQPAVGGGVQAAENEVLGGVIRIGSISNEPGSEIMTYQPFADYLAAQLNDAGIGRAEVVVASDIGHMSSLLARGEVDLYFDSPFPMLSLQQLQDVNIIARRWKKGVSEYHSVFFARKDSGIISLDQLAGRVVAFEEPFSTSSYLLPKASIIDHGLGVTASSVGIPGTSVGYVFSNDDVNTVHWVLKGKVIAGAINNQKFDSLPAAQREQFYVFHRTINVPRQLAGVRSDLSPQLTSRIKGVLLEMHSTEAGNVMLGEFEKTTKFDDFDEIPIGALRSLTAMTELIMRDVFEDTPVAAAD